MKRRQVVVRTARAHRVRDQRRQFSDAMQRAHRQSHSGGAVGDAVDGVLPLLRVVEHRLEVRPAGHARSLLGHHVGALHQSTEACARKATLPKVHGGFRKRCSHTRPARSLRQSLGHDVGHAFCGCLGAKADPKGVQGPIDQTAEHRGRCLRGGIDRVAIGVAHATERVHQAAVTDLIGIGEDAGTKPRDATCQSASARTHRQQRAGGGHTSRERTHAGADRSAFRGERSGVLRHVREATNDRRKAVDQAGRRRIAG
jgi:hypothetical protein